MPRQGGFIEPEGVVFKLGTHQRGGTITVWPDQVVFHLPSPGNVIIDPKLAPLFRMIANRLEEIAKKQEQEQVEREKHWGI